MMPTIAAKASGIAKVTAIEKTEVVTQTAPAILDTKTNVALSMEDAIIEILNKLDKIERSVA